MKKNIFAFLAALIYFSAFFILADLAKTANIPALLKNLSLSSKSAEMMYYIENYYYKDTSDIPFNDGMYYGLVDILGDPYSTYYSVQEYWDFLTNTNKSFAGVGVSFYFDKDAGGAVVSTVYPNSPGEKAGLTPGDIITHGAGVDFSTLNSSTEVTQYLRGDAGTKVDIVFLHEGKEISATITREVVIIPTVSYEMLDENTGYLQITSFGDKTHDEFMNAISALKDAGMENIVYDLRANPGGLVRSVTDILDEILPEGLTVYMLDKAGNKKEYFSDDKKQLPYPCAVLVNEGSTSSSEIFCGAIQDYGFGTIIGTRTLGKGVVQNVYPLKDGSAIRLTISSYYTPKGNSLSGVGITPDIELAYEYLLEDSEYQFAGDNQIQKALELLD